MLPLVALLAICRFPVALPAACGANVIAIAADCPAASVSGRVTALWLKPAPVIVRPLTVTATLEELLIVTFWLALEPVTTEPKASDCGLTLSVPCCGGGAGAPTYSYAPMS